MSKERAGVEPENLNFDIRRLDPGQFSSTYHFHRYAEEMFLILSGSATLRTTAGFYIVGCGDLVFFEKGETGAHQMFNHTDRPCTFLDLRSFTGFDVCEYPDSGKLLLVPSFEILKKDTGLKYFDGEEDPMLIWGQAGYKG